MDNILPWFALKSVPGIGNLLYNRIIKHFKSPEAVFGASCEELTQIEGVSDRLATTIIKHRLPEHVKKEVDLVAEKGFRIVTMADPDYPPLLLEIPDPPPFLYVSGILDSSSNNVAVVGSRNATDYGILITKRLCTDLASLNITVASGMARGIDTAAHEGALSGKGKTIAVLGSGLERIYPAQNQKLFHMISENGAVITELPLMAEPDAYNFPARNRIISGISLGTVVVEATKQSGSLITARLAAEQNREVFAVPGSIQSFKSTGTHTLIKQGAKLVEHAQDIVDELFHSIGPKEDITEQGEKSRHENLFLSEEESLVLKALGPYPVHIDDIIRKIKIEPGKIISILLKFELQDRVKQSPGKLFYLA
ncbi:MAG: DNA-processing protein DprA [Proteobacteria bacterium]|nr:DNA-processing protein DprA [Pseudomonadota bacterium]MBU1711924.1 DNA-processing protein DprA [Pseudomonadota bacterium]